MDKFKFNRQTILGSLQDQCGVPRWAVGQGAAQHMAATYGGDSQGAVATQVVGDLRDQRSVPALTGFK